jgi:hypothetical protein
LRSLHRRTSILRFTLLFHPLEHRQDGHHDLPRHVRRFHDRAYGRKNTTKVVEPISVQRMRRRIVVAHPLAGLQTHDPLSRGAQLCDDAKAVRIGRLRLLHDETGHAVHDLLHGFSVHRQH